MCGAFLFSVATGAAVFSPRACAPDILAGKNQRTRCLTAPLFQLLPSSVIDPQIPDRSSLGLELYIDLLSAKGSVCSIPGYSAAAPCLILIIQGKIQGKDLSI